MNSGKTVFAQLMDFIPTYEFRRCVARYRGQYRVRSFSCWDQFLAMAFAQLTYRESLRDIETCLRALGGKLYHMGIRGQVSRTTLADANESRDWRIFADLAQRADRHRAASVRGRAIGGGFGRRPPTRWTPRPSICACRCFPWARFRRLKAAVKMHTLLDLRGNHSRVYPHYRRQDARHQRPRSDLPEAGRFLCDGSRLLGLSSGCTASRSARPSSSSRTKVERSAPATLLASGGQEHRRALRSDRRFCQPSNRPQVYPDASAPRQLLRRGNRQALDLSDQQLHACRR